MTKYFFLATALLAMFAVQGQVDVLHVQKRAKGEGSFPRKNAGYFLHGVASGDPTDSSVVLWTRITPDELTGTHEVNWEIASDIAFSDVLDGGTAVTDSSADFTVHLHLSGLPEDSYLFYRFNYEGESSVTGRTRTLPMSGGDDLRIAAVSCSDYRQGYFNAYAHIAGRNDIDLVIHLGDYIYETGGEAERLHDPDAEIYRLADYRTRYNQYRLDPDLQRMHQLYPVLTIWDDHDIVVDATRDTSMAHQAQFGNYSTRKSAAIEAAREWLPLSSNLEENPFKNWRSVQWGDLARIILVDVRLFDRDLFVNSSEDPLFGDPDHKLMGPEQQQWFLGELDNEQQWNLVGNQLMVGQFRAAVEPIIYENWDGYPAERDTFFNFLQTHEIDNTVFMTGDFHVSIACNLCPEPRDTSLYDSETGEGSIGVEFVVPSITGVNFDEGYDFGLANPESAAQNLQIFNNHYQYVELTEHGFVLLHVNNERAQGEYWHMASILDDANHEASIGEIWFATDGQNRLTQGFAPAVPDADEIPVPDACSIVSVEESSAPRVVMLYPNPASDVLFVNLLSNDLRTVTVIDLNGKVWLQKQPDATAGFSALKVDISNLPSGSFVLRITDKTGLSTSHRFVRE